MAKKIQITISPEEYEIIIDELRSLVSYKRNDDYIHSDQCFSEGITIIECNNIEIDT